MTTLMQRARGALGIGLTWAAAWTPVGALTGLLTNLTFGFPLAEIMTNFAVMFGVLGLIGGAIFSTVLSLAERRRQFEQLSLPRFVGWGTVGGLVLGGLAVSLSLLGSGAGLLGAVIVGTCTLLGAGSAAGTLAIARAADRQVALGAGYDAPGE